MICTHAAPTPREILEPPELGILNAFRFGTDPLQFLNGVQARFEDITAVPIPSRVPLVIVTNPSQDVSQSHYQRSRIRIGSPFFVWVVISGSIVMFVSSPIQSN